MTNAAGAAAPLGSGTAGALTGEARVPGDKSISHRALILGALATGTTEIAGLLEGEDVLRTIAAIEALGAGAERLGTGQWRIKGCGVGGLGEPGDILDMGNAGTPTRLMLGVLATHPITAFLTGDASLRGRPMLRATEPLARMGATFVTRCGGRLPIAVTGAESALAITYQLPVPSAQVKSAVLLAGLNARGRTTVIEPQPTRDHTERMLRHFGVPVAVDETSKGRAISIDGFPEFGGATIIVPGDPSSAAFPLVAALLLPGSDIRLINIAMNPGRIGLLDCLREMGADITRANQRTEAGEPVADLIVRASRLRAIDVPPERAPSMIDEYPILAVAAAFAEGTTVMRGLAELRVKESDRLAAIAEGLAAAGVTVEAGADSLAVRGGGRPPGGVLVASRLDHRIAMAFLVLGMASKKPITIDDGRPIETSFPTFVSLMRGLGADIGPAPA
ncbi:MAG: 3-phosphoshikimate 1-carboxyvinyltransferase [Alphaproteobacteria bacterium]|nr:3-phosphoshikimate 1-carboxyvinyltransferase [Alphaproteobacteria bacterium]